MVFLPRFYPFLRFALFLTAYKAHHVTGLSAAATKPTSTTHANTVRTSVYDNVLTQPACDSLHTAASQLGLGHKVFSRPIQNPHQHPLIERMLDSILAQVGDDDEDHNKQYVEYWTRQEWRHIEAHADVDEFLAKEQDRAIAKGDHNTQKEEEEEDSVPMGFRYPDNGHVLYLKVGSDVRGPTCIFPRIENGGDLLKQTNTELTNNKVQLVTVPAVNGRLLRFAGSALHAVPRPADLWFLPFVQGASQHSPEETWGRSVILFNTWDKNPPTGMPVNEVLEDDVVETRNVDVNERRQWKEVFTLTDKECYNNSNENSSCGNIQSECSEDEEDEATSKVKIWLLGNDRRREYPKRTVQMKAKSSVRDAFLEPRSVSCVELEQ